MRGGSLASVDAARAALDRELGPASPAAAATRSAELFALVDALDTNPPALRALANPNRPAAAKRDMVAAMMAGHDPTAIRYAGEVVAARWSHDRDLADALEQLGIEAALIGIEAAGGLEAFEDELRAVERFLAGQRAVRLALAEPDAEPDARVQLAKRLLADLLAPATMDLVAQVVRSPRRRSLVGSLILLEELSAARRGRMVATVSVAGPINAAQTERLSQILQDAYGHAFRLDIVTDPGMVGGLRVAVGSDLLDATLLARLTSLRRAIAS
ncbi:MAG: F0F1 ATP synthase subunit delta [Bifidobacteriaceae bacterium]|jgi:F-type H+-transporting ATPase subunit delta|nr:F0F1 ATP synthase subunit delta [Bifidobacteriaceae bacterium]